MHHLTTYLWLMSQQAAAGQTLAGTPHQLDADWVSTGPAHI